MSCYIGYRYLVCVVREATLLVKHTDDSSGIHYLTCSHISLHTSTVEVYFATFSGRHLTQILKSQCSWASSRMV
jgi:hypothetical protein